MLYVQFSIDNNRYLVATDQVITLMPVVEIHGAEQVTDWFPGCINFKGEWVPVIDVVQILGNRPARLRLSTRIILVRLHGNERQLQKAGLLVEKVAELVRLEDSSFSGIKPELQENPGLDALAIDEYGTLQRVQAGALISDLAPVLLNCNGLTH